MHRLHLPLILARLFLLIACLFSFSEAVEIDEQRLEKKNRKNRKHLQEASIPIASESSVVIDNNTLPSEALDYIRSTTFTNLPLHMSPFDDLLVIEFMDIEDIRFKALLYDSRNDRDFFLAILKRYKKLIGADFLKFWDVMLAMPSDDVEEEMYTRLHQSVHWAFEYFLPDDQDSIASFCLFDLLLNDPSDPLPESMVKSVLALPGIDLNASHRNSCVALFTLGVPSMPHYYPKLILSDPRLNVNCIVPATVRRYKHITCHVPNMPLFWHALIYQNYQAALVLLQNKNIHLLTLVPSFFVLLRLFIIFCFYSLWDGNVPKVSKDRYKFERIIS